MDIAGDLNASARRPPRAGTRGRNFGWLIDDGQVLCGRIAVASGMQLEENFLSFVKWRQSGVRHATSSQDYGAESYGVLPPFQGGNRVPDGGLLDFGQT